MGIHVDHGESPSLLGGHKGSLHGSALLSQGTAVPAHASGGAHSQQIAS